MDIPKVEIEDTPMQAFVRDEISSYRKCSLLYSDRLKLLSDTKNWDNYPYPKRIEEEKEALRRILIAYKKLDTTLISQIEGLTPYYDCNLSNLTNIHADLSQPYKNELERVLAIIDHKAEYEYYEKSRPARCKQIRNEIHYHSNRHEIYMSRYDAFDKKKSMYGVREVAVGEVVQTIYDLISLTKIFIEKLVGEYKMSMSILL